MESSTQNTGRYIIGFGVFIILANLVLFGFLVLNERGIISVGTQNTQTVDELPIEDLISAPISAPN